MLSRHDFSDDGWNRTQDAKETDKSELNIANYAQESLCQRQASLGLIHHTDRGGQYAGDRYSAVLGRAEFWQSMSRPDNWLSRQGFI